MPPFAAEQSSGFPFPAAQMSFVARFLRPLLLLLCFFLHFFCSLDQGGLGSAGFVLCVPCGEESSESIGIAVEEEDALCVSGIKV